MQITLENPPFLARADCEWLNRNSETTCPLHFGDDIGCILQEGVDQLDFLKPLFLSGLAVISNFFRISDAQECGSLPVAVGGHVGQEAAVRTVALAAYDKVRPLPCPVQQRISGLAHESETAAGFRARVHAETQRCGHPLTRP
jgi:hypothetical protein